MVDYKLRNHIPLSGPATREPFIGDEPDLRIVLGFTPKWYHERLGIDFSNIWHADPVYRYESLIKMKTLLNNIFPQVADFKIDMENGIEKTCATISGVHGIMLIPLIYGIGAIYRKDGWPDAIPGQHMTKEMIKSLEPFDLMKNPVIEDLLAQMETIERNWNMIHGYLNYQGILNIALKVRGNDIFTDMTDDPLFVHCFFEHIARTIKDVSELIQARQRKSGFYVNLLSLSNCVMNMVSPQMYEEFVLPYDRILSEERERFGIHTCNWNVTPYIEVLRKIKKVGYIDMGIISDMKRVKNVFPDARRAVLYSPVALEQKSMEEIRLDMMKVYSELAPCDIILADIESTTSDIRINNFLSMIDHILHQQNSY